MQPHYVALALDSLHKVVVVPVYAILSEPNGLKYAAADEQGALRDTVVNGDESETRFEVGNEHVVGRIGYDIEAAPKDVHFRVFRHGGQM